MSISLIALVFNLALPESASKIQWKTKRESIFGCNTTIPSPSQIRTFYYRVKISFAYMQAILRSTQNASSMMSLST